MGGSGALIVPSSGIVTWKSDSASSRKASKGSSVRSSSSISSTGAPPAGAHRLQQRAADQEALREELWLQRLAVGRPRPRRCGSRSSARRSSIRRRPRPRPAPRSTAAGSAGGRARRPAPWRSRSCRPRLAFEEQRPCRASARGTPPCRASRPADIALRHIGHTEPRDALDAPDGGRGEEAEHRRRDPVLPGRFPVSAP
jgi:hypothetical protein